MKNNLEGVLTVIGLLMLVVILLGLPLQLLWNWLMPSIFNLPYITFWQAVGLNTISSILFKSNINIKNN
jgi:hypothetical protein